LFFAFLEEGGRERVQDICPLDVRDHLDVAKAGRRRGPSDTVTLRPINP
jgi:hypothetical protein